MAKPKKPIKSELEIFNVYRAKEMEIQIAQSRHQVSFDEWWALEGNQKFPERLKDVIRKHLKARGFIEGKFDEGLKDFGLTV